MPPAPHPLLPGLRPLPTQLTWIYRYTLPSRAGQGPPGKVGEGGADVIHRETGPVWKRWVIHQMVLWQRVVEGKEEEDVEAKSIQ